MAMESPFNTPCRQPLNPLSPSPLNSESLVGSFTQLFVPEPNPIGLINRGKSHTKPCKY